MDFCFPSIFIVSFNDELKVPQSLHWAGTKVSDWGLDLPRQPGQEDGPQLNQGKTFKMQIFCD